MENKQWVSLPEEVMEDLILKHAPPLHPLYPDEDLHELIQAVEKWLRGKN